MNEYVVTEVADDFISVWDGKTKDPDHPTKPGGIQTFHFSLGHQFKVGDKVELVVRKLSSGAAIE